MTKLNVTCILDLVHVVFMMYFGLIFDIVHLDKTQDMHQNAYSLYSRENPKTDIYGFSLFAAKYCDQI